MSKFFRKLYSSLQSDGTLHKVFQDYQHVTVRGGSGGSGASLFLSLYRKEFAGPSGGDGGNGGHVIFEASPDVKSLIDVKKTVIGLSGSSGRHGKGGAQDGANAKHLFVHVPLGTIIKENGSQLIDLKEKGSRYIAARGGYGGLGNRTFATSEETAPTKSSKGSPGECRYLELELSIVADIGLVGFPNAGKSSLLRCISKATPLVANYPFTTLNPHVGVVDYRDSFRLAVADIPGIIKGAHLNKGLGLSFLKHIRRCSSLVYVLDVSVPTYLKQLQYLKFELNQYQPGLAEVPNLVVANKIDTEGGSVNFRALTKKLPSESVVGISALYNLNTDLLREKLRKLHERNR
ncbi:mitochondrial ribosome-associated GTPase 2-like [Symsagittifera roscoffensis]|uniref:mitochondrial ribosome-associated GTPase 2-like n=1 Tax=Symsagittifera roscoffensis TaxID=84072 RepID=UPI00307C9663